MAGTIFRIGAVTVFIAAEDHPPPHVHAVHVGEGWRARFRFSFLSDVAGLYRFRRRGRRPTEAALNVLLDAIVEHLPACRAAWWATHGSRHELGLVNRLVETRAGRPITGDFVARISTTSGPDAVRIDAAAYDPLTAEIALILADGRHMRLAAGQHIEEAAEW